MILRSPQESRVIDGRSIQSKHLRKLSVHHQHFASYEVFAFLPKPGCVRASEAFISAREKERAFRSLGFQFTKVRIDDALRIARAKEKILSGKAFYVIQRPLRHTDVMSQEMIGTEALEIADLESGNASSLSETVSRIVEPFLDTYSRIGQRLVVGIIGIKGFFGAELKEAFLRLGVAVVGCDLADSAQPISTAQIVISVVGKAGIVNPSVLVTRKRLLVDVGYTYDERTGRGCGDFSPSCYVLSDFHTPVPGGVGPLQVLTLVERAVARTGHRDCKRWTLPPEAL